MKFIDFKTHQLIGMPVVWTTGNNSTGKGVKVITKISETNREGFRIESDPVKIFSYKNGHEKLTEGKRRVSYASISQCELINEDDANELKSKFEILKKKKDTIQFIMANQIHLTKLSLRDLERFSSKLKLATSDGFKRENP